MMAHPKCISSLAATVQSTRPLESLTVVMRTQREGPMDGCDELATGASLRSLAQTVALALS